MFVVGVPGHRTVRQAAVSDGVDSNASRSGVRLHGRGEGRRQLVPVGRAVCLRQRCRKGRTGGTEERFVLRLPSDVVESTQAAEAEYKSKPGTKRVQALADMLRSALCCYSNETPCTDCKSAK